jgi:outer membrane protein TolC
LSALPLRRSTVIPRGRWQTALAEVAGGETQHFVQGLDIPGHWWTLFHSEALNNLIEQALKNNPTLPAARAAQGQAWENVGLSGENARLLLCSEEMPARVEASLRRFSLRKDTRCVV